MPRPRFRFALACVSTTLGLAGSPAAAASPSPAAGEGIAEHVPGEVILGYENGRTDLAQLPDDVAVGDAVDRLERRSRVEFAVPNYVATAAALVDPLDVGTAMVPGAWAADQWSFLAQPGGIRVRGAWDRLATAGRSGGARVTVAVVDTGIAYAPTLEGRDAAPDFNPAQFVGGIDLVDDDDRPLDENGHGTHVAAIIGEQLTLGRPATSNDYLTGIAYGAKLMPIRVLDHAGAGAASDIAAGILWAAKHGADVINVSLQFDTSITSCEQVPTVCTATKRAARRGAIVIAAGGNALEGFGRRGPLFPAAAPGVLALGATTEHGCLADYSHFGKGIEMVAPGGGSPRFDANRPECRADNRPILALTLECFPGPCSLGLYGAFAIRADTGTSMASAHTSAVAALVIAAGTAGKKATPKQIARRLRCSARPLSPRRFYGAGQLDALRAVQPKFRCK